jgi:hypothetical protein
LALSGGRDKGNYAELPVMPTGAYGPVQDGGFRCNLGGIISGCSG